MLKASQTLDRYYLEMRNKCLSLAADLDRIARADGGPTLLADDPRLQKLHAALSVLIDREPGKRFGPNPPAKAERVQMIFSDRTQGPNA